MSSLHFKLFLAFALVLGLVTSPALAQDDSGPLGVADLPDCAQSCATAAAAAANCATTDTACLCKAPSFLQSTLNCANGPGVCGIEDRSSTEGVLDNMCPQQPDPTPPASAPVPSTPTPSTAAPAPTGTTTPAGTTPATPAGTTNTAAPTHSTSTPVPTPTPTAATPPANTLAAPKPETTADPNTNTAAPPVGAGAGTGAGTGTGTGTTGTGLRDPNAADASSTVVIVNTVVLPQTTDVSGSGAMNVAISKIAFLPVVISVLGGFLVL